MDILKIVYFINVLLRNNVLLPGITKVRIKTDYADNK
jgi:hypothetical protein